MVIWNSLFTFAANIAEETMIRAKIKQAMRMRGVSGVELAKVVGISTSTLSSFLNGRSGMSVDKIDAALRYLKIELMLTLDT